MGATPQMEVLLKEADITLNGSRPWDPQIHSEEFWTRLYGLGTLGLFVLESALFTALAGGSFGKLATRLRVVRKDAPGQPVSLLRALVRSVLVALLVPPLLTFDGRGLHDLAAGTRTVTI